MHRRIIALIIALVLWTGVGYAESAPPPEVETAFMQAATAFEWGDYEGAAALLTDAMLLAPENPEYRYFRALAYQAMGNISAALMDQGISLAQLGHPDIYASRAQLLLLEERYSEALQDIEKTLEQSSPSENAYYMAAYVRSMMGDHAEALVLVEEGLAKFPDSAGLLSTKGIVLYRQGEFEQALENYQAVLNAGIEAAMVYYNIAESLFMLGRDEEAQTAAEKAAALGGTASSKKSAEENYQIVLKETAPIAPEEKAATAEKLQAEGIKLLEDGQYEQALELLLAAIDLMPGNAEWYEQCGDAYCGIKDYERAGEYYAFALPEIQNPLALYGKIIDTLQKSGKTADEAAMWGYLSAMLPDDAMLHNNYAFALRVSQKPEKALQEYDRAIELDGEIALYYGGRADLLMDMQRYAEAEEDYKRCIALDPTDEMAKITLQICLSLQGKESEINADAFADDASIVLATPAASVAPEEAHAAE